MASSRIFVQEGIHDIIVNKMAEKAKNWVIGDPFDPSTRHGPQVCFFFFFLCIQAKTINKQYQTLLQFQELKLNFSLTKTIHVIVLARLTRTSTRKYSRTSTMEKEKGPHC